MSLATLDSLIPFFDYRGTLVNVPTGIKTLCEANSQRVAFICSSLTTGATCCITPMTTSSTHRGIFVPNQGSPIVITVQQFGPLARRAWNVVNTAGTPGDLYLLEVLYFPNSHSGSIYVPSQF